MIERIDELVVESKKRHNLKEENEVLKANIYKKKPKREKAKDEVKELKNEVHAIKLEVIRNLIVEKFVLSFVVVLIVVHLTKAT